MNPLASAILISWRRNAGYGVRLIEDVPASRFTTQPARLTPGIVLNHPAWVFSHLNLYAEVAVKLARGEAFEDPADHRFGQKSSPLADPGAYDPKDRLVEAWTRWHEMGSGALERSSVAFTSSPNPLERWRAMHPTVGDMLVTLMVKHESSHLGQLSAWRRACGLPRVAL